MEGLGASQKAIIRAPIYPFLQSSPLLRRARPFTVNSVYRGHENRYCPETMSPVAVSARVEAVQQ